MLEKIKLIIWDLDETLWTGTLSEGEVNIVPQFFEFLNQTADYGIVHSICSKNDRERVNEKLSELGIADCFVFNSINWEAKGERIKNIIKNMALREVNVLFIDDNIQNLEEARFLCPAIHVMLPGDMTALLQEAKGLPSKDPEHKRMKQYRQLEQKVQAQQNFHSNEEFLFSCQIHVTLSEDCNNVVDRIHELVQRSNQLNFTKRRDSKEDLEKLLKSPNVKAGYVSVRDRFGDYGIVGFYALQEGRLIHFLFSCRTLGMGVEQYVYTRIGHPELTVTGEVASVVDAETLAPPWINCNEKMTVTVDSASAKNPRILIKGPCDLEQMRGFLGNDSPLICEFSYVGEHGILVEGMNHLAQISTMLDISEQRKKELCAESPWFDSGMLTTHLGKERFDVVVFSMLATCNLGVYRRKKTGELISLCESYYDLTNLKNRHGYLSGKYYTSNIVMNSKDMDEFSMRYEYVDYFSGNHLIDDLNKLHTVVAPGHLVLILGTEQKFKRECKEAYFDRHLLHRKINQKVREWAKGYPDVSIIEIDKYIHSQNDWTNSTNHYVKKVYYEMAGDLLKILKETSPDISYRAGIFLPVMKDYIISRTIRPMLRLYRKIFRRK